MNENRKMATIREVTEVVPIENADRIEVTVVDGWRVITKKGEFEVGDLCVYLEIDTFCPTTVEPLAFLAERGTRIMDVDGNEVRGHVLKTVRLRGVYSQGLCVAPSEFGISGEEARRLCDEEADVSERIGVCEYVRPVKAGGSPRFIKNPYDRSVAPVTDAERVQNCTKIWPALRKVDAYCTVKVDGRSTTIVYDPRREKLRLFSHHRELDYEYRPEDGSKTIAQISYETAERQGIVGFCMSHPGKTVQFELTGPKIQRSMTSDYACHVFAVWDMVDMHKYTIDEIAENGWDEIATAHVKVMGMTASSYETPQDLLDAVDRLRDNVTKGKPDEGVVFHVTGRGETTDDEWQQVQNKLGPNLEFKAVSNRYLLKGKE